MSHGFEQGQATARRKLHPRYMGPVFAFIMSAVFALIMSGVLTAYNLGLVPGFLGLWMRNYGVAWLVAFPTAMIVVPLVRRLVGAIVEMPHGQGRPGGSSAAGR